MFDTAQPQAEQRANQPDTNTGTGQKDAQKDAFLTVRYNKEALPLSREAAAEYAQKGLNYDKLSGRLEDASKKLEAYEDLSVLAKELAQHGGIGEKEALDMVLKRIGDENQKQAEVNAQLESFLEAHPDLDVCTLPEEVISVWKNGVPLQDAYARHDQMTKRQQTVRQTNAHNAAASMGGALGSGAAAPRPLSNDAIKQMTPGELEKNHSRIWAFLTGQKE